MTDDAEPSNIFFRLVVIAAGAFVVTILASIATLLGDERAPLARFLNQYGGALMAGEVAATLLIGLLALITDRRQSSRRQSDRRLKSRTKPSTSSPSKPGAKGEKQPNGDRKV